MFRRRLGGLEQIELGFPIAQHVGFDTDDFTHFADLKIYFLRQARRHDRSYSAAVEPGEDSGDEDMPFKLFFMIWLALKVKTLRATLLVSSPGCGFCALGRRFVLL